jgi:hypothetical protein
VPGDTGTATELVEDTLALSAVGNQPREAEDGKVVTDRRLPKTKRAPKTGHVPLSRRQSQKDSQPRLV